MLCGEILETPFRAPTTALLGWVWHISNELDSTVIQNFPLVPFLQYVLQVTLLQCHVSLASSTYEFLKLPCLWRTWQFRESLAVYNRIPPNLKLKCILFFHGKATIVGFWHEDQRCQCTNSCHSVTMVHPLNGQKMSLTSIWTYSPQLVALFNKEVYFAGPSMPL